MAWRCSDVDIGGSGILRVTAAKAHHGTMKSRRKRRKSVMEGGGIKLSAA